MKLPNDTPPLLLIRLSPTWHKQVEEIEPGYLRAGHGWREGMTKVELRDSVRAWWRLDLARLERDDIDHVVPVVGGVTRALYRITSIIGPRERDGRIAFELSEVTTGSLNEKVIGTIGKTVEYRQGSANPIRYWPPRA